MGLQICQHHDQQGRQLREHQRHGHHVRQDDARDEEPQLQLPGQLLLPPRRQQDGQDEDDDEDDEDEQHDERPLLFFLPLRRQRHVRHVQRDFDSSSDRMDNYRSSDYSNQMGRMSHFKNMFNNMRYKRAAGDNLDLGDRLVEKLAEQKHHMEAKIGNMTCVMKELNVLDASNNIDV